jgi:Na+/H+ antiporter NhaD/arsenite permease-like protein
MSATLAVAIFLGAYGLIATEKVNRVTVALTGAGLLMALRVVSSADAFHSERYGIDWDVIFLLLGTATLIGDPPNIIIASQAYLAGARLLELFPVVPIMGNITLDVGVLSYAGQLNLTAMADRDTCPDLEVFAHGVRSTLDDLARSVLVPASKEA